MILHRGISRGRKETTFIAGDHPFAAALEDLFAAKGKRPWEIPGAAQAAQANRPIVAAWFSAALQTRRTRSDMDITISDPAQIDPIADNIRDPLQLNGTRMAFALSNVPLYVTDVRALSKEDPPALRDVVREAQPKKGP